jgi:hypothetical protein
LQFEERKFLETARKTILLSVGNAGQKLETEQLVGETEKPSTQGTNKKE